jgi:molybdate transport system ATP-binding protein
MAGELIAECRTRLASGFELDASLRIPLAKSPVTVLFGPSGAGKTTLLRMLAGLDRPASGQIVFRGIPWFDDARGIALDPQQRRAAFLFQDYALFPHLTVRENVAYATGRDRANELLSRFGLGDLADRLPRAISGGQQQRVALARALAAGPALLLLDEPLSALDAATRLRTRQELRRMLLESRVPSIVVTHDRGEAIALGDWMAVMVGGRIRQTGPVGDVFRRPADALVAESVGVENVLLAEVVGRQAGLVTVAVAERTLQGIDGGEAGAVHACIRAEDVAVARGDSTGQPSSVRNRLAGVVRSVVLEGPLARVELDCGFPLIALVTAQSAADLALAPGDAVAAAIKTTSVHLTAALQYPQ